MGNEFNIADNKTPEEILWFPPTITSPRAGDVITPGFLIEAEREPNRRKWRAQIFIGPTMLSEITTDYRVKFSHRVNERLIAIGAKFYFRVDYHDGDFWSSWAWSGDKVMCPPKPIITPPTQETTDKPVVFGRGYPGATVKLCRAGYGSVVYGSGVVGANGEWRIQITHPLAPSVFHMTANQSLNNVTSEWSENVTFIIRP
jgi:hypothetical protein